MSLNDAQTELNHQPTRQICDGFNPTRTVTFGRNFFSHNNVELYNIIRKNIFFMAESLLMHSYMTTLHVIFCKHKQNYIK